MQLLTALNTRRTALQQQHGRYVPLVVKIAPDINTTQIDSIAMAAQQCNIDGIIATNTTLSRTGVEDLPHGNEAGGLSGRPVGHLSTEIIKQFHERLEGKLPIIGVGGIDSGEKAVQKLNAGASMVQLYSGMIYKGPKLVQQCVEAITSHRDMY